MSEIFHLTPTEQTPEVCFDFAAGELSISGKSYPENVHEIYGALVERIEEYLKGNPPMTTINFEWLYYNTASFKMIVKILRMFKVSNLKFEVKWICKKDFKMMIEKGELIKEVMDINLIIALH